MEPRFRRIRFGLVLPAPVTTSAQRVVLREADLAAKAAIAKGAAQQEIRERLAADITATP